VAPPDAERSVWVRMYRSLSNMSRFALGYPLVCEPPFDDALASLGDAWLHDRLERWWQLEALRRWIVAELLAPRHWLLAACRYWDAFTAALSAIAARRGEINMSAKWLPQKLARLGETGLAQDLRQAATFPTEAELPTYRALVSQTLAAADVPGRRPEVVMQAWPADGVVAHRVGEDLLVARWQMRQVHLRRSELSFGSGRPVWQGPLDDDVPAEIAELIVEDMLWVGLASR
jgi:hypothetical protein